jgi:prolyl-tRNA editing enzyme YbaK/EbsC (Cys-tRNA(Pro) deacylase)
MRGSVDVHNYLSGLGIDHEIVLLDGEARTAAQAASMSGLQLSEIAETHIFDVDGAPVLVLAPGGRKVSSELLSAALGASKCRHLDRNETSRLTDYPAGAVPPVALKTDIPVLIDAAFGEISCIYTMAGMNGAILKLRLQDLTEALGGRVVAVAGE